MVVRLIGPGGLGGAHGVWDKRLAAVKNLLLAWSSFDPTVLASTQTSRVGVFYAASARLEGNFEKLNDAARRAKGRLTDHELAAFQGAGPSGRDFSAGGMMCAICMSALSEAGEAEEVGAECNLPLFLPCGHSFHGGCIRTWLHNHAQCPVCRFSLAETTPPDQRAAPTSLTHSSLD